MSVYIRPRVRGARIFFTVCLADRGSGLLVREVALLRDAVCRTRPEPPFGIEAWVVLPDHLHCIWALPTEDSDFSTRWGAIKARFTRSVREKSDPEKLLDGGSDRRPGFSPAPVPYPRELPIVAF